MELRQIQYFCAVVETGSFTRAAEKTLVSQSAISQQVKALETEFGFELLHRHGRSFDVTPAGELFARKAAALLEQLDDARFEAEGVANGWATTLSVGYLNRYEGWEVQAAVTAFAARHPHIPVHATAGSHDTLYQLILRHDVDLLFSDRRRALSDAFVNRHLFDGWQYVEVSEASGVAWASELTVAELAQLPCILIASPDQESIEREYYRDVLGFRSDFLFARSREEGRMMVAGNRGFMPIEMREQTDRTGSAIRRIPLVGQSGQLKSEYYCYWPKDRTNNLIEEFADILSGMFETAR
ncbi:MAG: LysR family transcriptional regulator [Coriobacteriales bacterium]|nr:LysR family transcriptional regulator [Coriobacteriales bacterium]